MKKNVDIYVAAHYKNSPDDLLLLADNPSHRLFVLLRESTESKKLLKFTTFNSTLWNIT